LPCFKTHFILISLLHAFNVVFQFIIFRSTSVTVFDQVVIFSNHSTLQ